MGLKWTPKEALLGVVKEFTGRREPDVVVEEGRDRRAWAQRRR